MRAQITIRLPPRIQKEACPDGVPALQESGINYCREAKAVYYPLEDFLLYTPNEEDRWRLA